jgi:hypothetical protein
MKRAPMLASFGAIVVAVGLFLAISADSLATKWYEIGDKASFGTTDPALRSTYHEIGLIAICVGAVFVAMAAWSWLAAERRPRQWQTHSRTDESPGV